MLSVRQISKAFNGKAVIKDVSFDVSEGQYFVLLGSSGVGKSLLFETIAGITSPDSGNVFLDGINITTQKIQKRKIGLVFQDSVLFPHMSVYDNVAYPLKCRKLSCSQIQVRVKTMADDFGFANLLNRKPSTLSGGESQRVSLARAVASEPRCLLLDEPLSSLDASTRPEIRALLRKMNSRGQTIVHVTHDYTEAVSVGTHIAVMEKGRIAQVGTTEEIFQRPKSEFIARFVGIRNFFKGCLQETTSQETNLREFTTVDGVSFSVLVDTDAGNGYVMIRSEDVTVSSILSQSSARNRFEAAIVDIVRAGPGIEVIVDIGQHKTVEIAAMVTTESTKEMDLRTGKKVWISFKASAVKYIEE
jgi:molybdate/tungstate transport system ATP-binding protein